MSTPTIVYILTALGAVVIALTHVRLGDGDARRLRISPTVVRVHTVAGTLAVVTWVVFLLLPGDSELTAAVVGIVAIGFWWITALAGLSILMRWLPARGRHAEQQNDDGWSEGPGVSVLAHLGMVAGVLVNTYAYLTAAV